MIFYETFGAAGDGRTNDLPAIIRAHEEANRRGESVRARQGACYYIAPEGQTAVIQTHTDWTGARFVIDDRGCEAYTKPVFRVVGGGEIPFALTQLHAGQRRVENPTGRRLHVRVENSAHADYIRKGLNQNAGVPRADQFVVEADGTLCSPVSLDFEQITLVRAVPVEDEELVLRGGTFVTLANEAASEYCYHDRGIQISRSHVRVQGLEHLVEGEGEHGAPYRGFLFITDCACVTVEDCLFTGHRYYWTIGTAGKPVPMGSYDINCKYVSQVQFLRCAQTNDIMDTRFWGLIGTNFCRDLLFEDCVFSRFDAHMGVNGCTLRRCELGWQCLQAIGYGTFLAQDTTVTGYAFVSLREDYGSTWQGDMVLKNCTWKPTHESRSVFVAGNDGTHDFGYPCALPRTVTVDGLTVAGDEAAEQTLSLFNDYTQGCPRGPYSPAEPERVTVRGVKGNVVLCANDALMQKTLFERE